MQPKEIHWVSSFDPPRVTSSLSSAQERVPEFGPWREQLDLELDHDRAAISARHGTSSVVEAGFRERRRMTRRLSLCDADAREGGGPGARALVLTGILESRGQSRFGLRR